MKAIEIISKIFLITVVTRMKMADTLIVLKYNYDHIKHLSYPPSLLPIMSKLFEKLLLKRLEIIIEERQLIPDHQFGFGKQHSTIDQVHRITDMIERSLEGKNICSVIFLDVDKAFDQVWHEGLNHKLKITENVGSAS